MKIGFIGQGWIGKNYADDFQRRGFDIVRFAKEPEYVAFEHEIKECDITFIAVPTPTTPQGFDESVVGSVLGLIGKGKIAVIKSTLLPGMTQKFQSERPEIILLNSPEFLSKKTAAYDAAHPIMNVIGIPIDDDAHRNAAQAVLSILPSSSVQKIVRSDEAELIKYAHNVHGFIRIVYSNLLYDIAQRKEMNWENISEVLKKDPMMSPYYLDPIHKSGRGAGGACFIKDFEAFLQFVHTALSDEKSNALLKSLRDKNTELLVSSQKDSEILRAVYGEGQY